MESNNKGAANAQYINSFEEDFETWVNQKSSIAIGEFGAETLKPAVQALVNEYHEVKGAFSPVDIPNFNTLKFFVSFSGASEEHSNQNESIKILDVAKRIISEGKP